MISSPTGPILYVHGIVTDPDMQGRGWARVLLTEAVRVAGYLALRRADN